MGLLESGNDNQLLLYRKWLALNKSREDKTQLVCNIALSNSGEWILIKTDESLALLSAESKVGQQLWEELQKFSGKAKALIIYPVKGKLGFDLDFHETKTTLYQWTDNGLEIGKKPEQQTSGISKISWEEAQLTSKNSTESKRSEKSKSKTESLSGEFSGNPNTTKDTLEKPTTNMEKE